MRLPATARWILLALLGLLIAAAVAIAASRLASRQIGIASESVSAGDALAPSLRTPGRTHVKRRQGGRDREPAVRSPQPTTSAEPPPPATTTTSPPPAVPERAPESGEDHGGGEGADD